MPTTKGIAVAKVPAALSSAFVLAPPAWTRLEPQSVSGNPIPGLEARVHDPLWLLTRQWQLGEFHGEDAGSPVSVEVKTTTSRIGAWQPGDPQANRAARAFEPTFFLEPAVEREPRSARGPGLRQRAEAGSQFLAMLDDAGLTGMGNAIAGACPLKLTWSDEFDDSGSGLLLLAGRVPDAEQLAARLEPALAEPPVLPNWFDGVADPDAAVAIAREWFAWYRGEVAPAADPDSDCWIDDRLEYRFSLRVDTPGGDQILRAPAYDGGRVDWYTFDHHQGAAPLVPVDGAGGTAAEERRQTLLATPLRFAGMPADRYWQFEDGQVNLGALEVQPHDLARLMLVEFAMVYGNDWLVVPLDVPFGTLAIVDEVAYTTTFGERFVVAEADDTGRSGRFRMFRISEAGTRDSIRGLFVPPAAAGVCDGPALEEVIYLRDEMANMAWAVERIVEGPSGTPRSRGDEPAPVPFTPSTGPGAEMDYLLQTDVPTWWIPLVPVSTGYRAVALRKGAMIKDGVEVEPVGVLLRPQERLTIRDEEVPREGVRVRRVAALARRIDGTYARWITRRVSVGRGEGASGLAFDSAIRRRRA